MTICLFALSLSLRHRNLRTRKRMLKKGSNFSAGFQPILWSPVKMFLCSKIPCLVWRSADFLQVFFAKTVCWTSTNILVLCSTKISMLYARLDSKNSDRNVYVCKSMGKSSNGDELEVSLHMYIAEPIMCSC
jgi:hypothetical protein